VNIKRIWAIATNTFREVFRDRILYLAGLFAILLVLAVVLLSEVSAGAENKITLDLGLAAIELFGLIVAVFVGTGLVSKEIEKRTALVLIAKPMSRTEFIAGKHVGLSAALTLLVTLMTAIYLIVMSLKQFQYPLDSLLMATVYIVLELSLVTAAAILFSVFTSSLVATTLTFAIYLMGHFSQNLVTLSRTIQNPAVQQMVKGIYLVFPDLSRLNLKNEAVYGSLPNTTTLLANAGYGLLYIVLLLAVAIFIFSYREF
jgi:ABC-type transport system involved in multi-copper enzyme maturation permease subunit